MQWADSTRRCGQLSSRLQLEAFASIKTTHGREPDSRNHADIWADMPCQCCPSKKNSSTWQACNQLPTTSIKVIFLINFSSAKWQQHFQDTIFSIYLNLSFSLFEVSAADLDAFASRPLHAVVEKHPLACPWLLGHLATETPHHGKVTFSFSTLLRFVIASQRVYSLWKMICQAHSLRRSSRRGSFFQPRVGSCALKWNRT